MWVYYINGRYTLTNELCNMYTPKKNFIHVYILVKNVNFIMTVQKIKNAFSA